MNLVLRRFRLEALIAEGRGISLEALYFIHDHIALGPYRIQLVRRRLEQVVEPLRIRKAYLVHRRNSDRILVVFLDGEKILVTVIARHKIELTIFLDRVRDLVNRYPSFNFQGISRFIHLHHRVRKHNRICPISAATPCVHSTCVIRIRILRNITFPGDFFLEVEIHADLA